MSNILKTPEQQQKKYREENANKIKCIRLSSSSSKKKSKQEEYFTPPIIPRKIPIHYLYYAATKKLEELNNKFLKKVRFAICDHEEGGEPDERDDEKVVGAALIRVHGLVKSTMKIAERWCDIDAWVKIVIIKDIDDFSSLVKSDLYNFLTYAPSLEPSIERHCICIIRDIKLEQEFEQLKKKDTPLSTMEKIRLNRLAHFFKGLNLFIRDANEDIDGYKKFTTCVLLDLEECRERARRIMKQRPNDLPEYGFTPRTKNLERRMEKELKEEDTVSLDGKEMLKKETVDDYKNLIIESDQETEEEEERKSKDRRNGLRNRSVKRLFEDEASEEEEGPMEKRKKKKIILEEEEKEWSEEECTPIIKLDTPPSQIYPCTPIKNKEPEPPLTPCTKAMIEELNDILT
jgi:hypothetical protein